MRLHLAAQPAQVQGRIDPAQQMIARNHVFEIEFIEKTVLPTYRLTHHRPDPVADSVNSRESHRPEPLKGLFQQPQPGADFGAFCEKSKEALVWPVRKTPPHGLSTDPDSCGSQMSQLGAPKRVRSVHLSQPSP
jgi:hypothetical protein